MNFDEQKFLLVHDRVSFAYETLQPIPPHDLAQLLTGSIRLHEELILTRQRLAAAQQAASTPPLL